MSEKPNYNFLNMHVITSHSPSCLNRDDMNMQKSAVFGGVRRVRISSQCLKRAIRKCDYYCECFGEPSIRTRDIARLKEEAVKDLQGRYDKAFVEDVIDRFTGIGKYAKKKKEGDEDSKKGEKGAPVAPWALKEVEQICETVRKAGNADEKAIEKAVKEASKALLSTFSHSGLDIALSGRMATSGLMTSVDGAFAVAHAITTHETNAEVDWFTAVDDLTEESGETGAGHLNTQEFGAGVFYRYSSLNISQLQTNLGGVARSEALSRAANLVYLLASVVPTAKQNSFAAFNMADMVLLSFSQMPLSLANAFEKPVKRDAKGGLTGQSIKALESYLEKVYAGYGLNDRLAVFSLWETTLKPQVDSIQALMDWVRQDGAPR